MPRPEQDPGPSRSGVTARVSRRHQLAGNPAGHDDGSGLKTVLENSLDLDSTGADLGYIGVDGIGIVPVKRLGGELRDWQRQFNADFSKIRAAVEHAVAKVKTWRILSREGGRYRCPIDKFESMLAAITGLFFFAEYSND